MFATDGEYTAFANVAVGQFESIKDHARALREVSLMLNGSSGKVAHEIVGDGSIYFGNRQHAGNTDETAKFPSMVALIWRWTGDNGFRDRMYGFTRRNMEYIFRELDDDDDGWPEGLGNVERPGMGEEKLDNTVSTIRGLYDLADMARSKDDKETRRWAERKARELHRHFERAWWMDAPHFQYADSLDDPGNRKVQQKHWIGVTPMEIELRLKHGPWPGLADYEHGGPGAPGARDALLQRQPPVQRGPLPHRLRRRAHRRGRDRRVHAQHRGRWRSARATTAASARASSGATRARTAS